MSTAYTPYRHGILYLGHIVTSVLIVPCKYSSTFHCVKCGFWIFRKCLISALEKECVYCHNCELCLFVQSFDLVTMNASEDDKIKAMMDQSTKDFDQSRYIYTFSLSACICALP